MEHVFYLIFTGKSVLFDQLLLVIKDEFGGVKNLSGVHFGSCQQKYP